MRKLHIVPLSHIELLDELLAMRPASKAPIVRAVRHGVRVYKCRAARHRQGHCAPQYYFTDYLRLRSIDERRSALLRLVVGVNGILFSECLGRRGRGRVRQVLRNRPGRDYVEAGR